MLPRIFRRCIIREFGDASKLLLEEVETQEFINSKLRPTDVVIRNKVAGVNFIDTYCRSGLYPSELPLTLGKEAVGHVVHVGDKVDPGLVGQRMAYFTGAYGSYAEVSVVPRQECFPVPEALSDEVACAALLQGCTAHYLANDCHNVRSGTVALVHAAAGGTGLILGQTLKALGATVIGTASNEEKRAKAIKVGRCDHVVDYSQPPEVWAAEVKELAPKGVDVVYDGVGKRVFLDSLPLLRKRGSMVTFGNASGPVDPIAPLMLTKFGSISLQRPSLAHYSDPGEIEVRMADVFKRITDGNLQVEVGHVYELDDVMQCHLDLEAGKTTGKVLIALP